MNQETEKQEASLDPALTATPSRIPSWLLWTLAVLLTLAIAFYQKTTGPTYPIRGTASIGGEEISYKLKRSHGGEGDAEIRIKASNQSFTGTMDYRRFRSHDDWASTPLERSGEELIARIPHQPPAGKVMYKISITPGNNDAVSLTQEPVIIRFRGGVPAFILIPHIIFMFVAMLMSTRTGFEGLCRRHRVQGMTALTLVTLFLGGLVGGPIVQKYAFGAYWTGWPFGHDLTDNKTAVTFIFWLIAYWRIRKKSHSHGWAIAGAIVLLVVFLIPHSMLGSELDFTQMPEPTP